jgi:hypothetical protein
MRSNKANSFLSLYNFPIEDDSFYQFPKDQTHISFQVDEVRSPNNSSLYSFSFRSLFVKIYLTSIFGNELAKFEMDEFKKSRNQMAYLQTTIYAVEFYTFFNTLFFFCRHPETVSIPKPRRNRLLLHSMMLMVLYFKLGMVSMFFLEKS